MLKDYEIAAYWRAADGLGYPCGPLFKFLTLTAVRRNEAAHARWSEIDLGAKLWEIPGKRMKNGAAHVVPLTPDLVALLESLPRYPQGDFIFSNTGGMRPIGGFSRIKERLDEAMRVDSEAQGLPFVDFTIHDVRRTVRTQLSKLRISGEVAEALLAHAKPGLHRVYNLHDFEPEKREALELWHSRLKSIVEPTPDNVVKLQRLG